ncbi:MAG: Ig-like domain-containing protein, partial [Planctomycetota bacterium]
FTYTISDTGAGVGATQDAMDAATGTVTVSVSAVNDPPVVVADAAVNATEDTQATFATGSLLSNDSAGPANEGQSLSVTAVSPTSAQGGTATLNGMDIIYTPADDFNGTDTLTYTISDGEASETGTLTIVVAAVNDAPVPGDVSVTAVEDTPRTISSAELLDGATAGPADEAGQTLSIADQASTATTAGGTVSVTGGVATYTPSDDFFGSDSFTVTINDDGTPSQSSTLTVTVDVASINDPPVTSPDSRTAFVNVTATYTADSLVANDSAGPANESGQSLSISGVTAASTLGGTVTLNGDGNIEYTPPADMTGTDTITYTVSDGIDSTQSTITVTIEEFRPTTVSGSVFFDSFENGVRDGAQSANEVGVAGITVRLTSDASQNVTGQAVQTEVLTGMNGHYAFNNLAPGTYVVTYQQNGEFRDGADAVFSQLGDADDIENQFTVVIAEPGPDSPDAGAGYNFSLLGYSSTMNGFSNALDLLAHNYLRQNPELAAATNNGADNITLLLSDSGDQYQVAGSGFEDAAQVTVMQVSESGDGVQLRIELKDGTVHTVLVNGQQLLSANSGRVLRVLGGLDLLLGNDA